MSGKGEAPARAGIVLGSLIAVAAVANLGLAVALRERSEPPGDPPS
jgi:hypothetical protein